MSVLLSTISYIFDSNVAIDNYENLIMNSLREEFPFINKVTLPVNAPTEIPRFILTSHHGFSSVVITANMFQLTTKFNNEYKSDWNGKCCPYLEKKARLLSSFFEKCGINIKYSGVTLNATAQTNFDSVKKIENKFIKQTVISDLPLYDIMLKQTFVFEGKYFVNIQMQNQRFSQNNGVMLNTVFGLPESSNTVGFILDINDRKIANSDARYFSNQEAISKIMLIISKLISSGVEQLINTEDSICLN